MGRVGIKTIAEDAGVHPSTVSLAMRNDSRIPAATRERIHMIASKLNYRPNYFARGLRGKRVNSVGILVPRLRDPYIIDLIDAQEKLLRKEQYLPLLAVTNSDPADEIKIIQDLLARGVDGFVFNYAPQHSRTLGQVKELVEAGTPVSLLGEMDGVPGVDTVGVDLETSSCEITRHLLAMGHRDICLISMAECDSREVGYRKAYEEAGFEVDPSMILRATDAHIDADSLCAGLMSRPAMPTAVFAFNDDLAIELIARFTRSGISVPGDMSVVGVNDDWYSANVLVPLTTIRLAPQKYGASLVRMLMERINDPSVGPRRLVLPGELVLRRSAGPPGVSGAGGVRAGVRPR